jgi:hypothetical protein
MRQKLYLLVDHVRCGPLKYNKRHENMMLRCDLITFSRFLRSKLILGTVETVID